MHHHSHGHGGKNAHYVWWCGWLTAIATGFGALPFYWIRDVDKFYGLLGVSLLLGSFFGVLFIKFTKVFLEDYENVSVCGLKGLDTRKALLIMAVMTLHLCGIRRGHIVTMTMAIHNISEGIAISLSLVPRRLSVFYAVLWCIQWLPILPCGLGFAGGAMAYVAVQELLPESLEDTKSLFTTISAPPLLF
ncbi:hypothetical protein Plhal703r1_c41g0141511 [Plasmopara halstedii]